LAPTPGHLLLDDLLQVDRGGLLQELIIDGQRFLEKFSRDVEREFERLVSRVVARALAKESSSVIENYS
jgi:hypothetical protein